MSRNYNRSPGREPAHRDKGGRLERYRAKYAITEPTVAYCWHRKDGEPCRREMQRQVYTSKCGSVTVSWRCPGCKYAVSMMPKRAQMQAHGWGEVYCVKHQCRMKPCGGRKEYDEHRVKCPVCLVTLGLGYRKPRAGDIEASCMKCYRRLRNSGSMLRCLPCGVNFQKVYKRPYRQGSRNAVKYVAHCLGMRWPQERCGSKYYSGGREGDVQRLACPKCKYTIRANPKSKAEKDAICRRNREIAREKLRDLKAQGLLKYKARGYESRQVQTDYVPGYVSGIWREDYGVTSPACCMQCCKGFHMKGKIRRQIWCGDCRIYARAETSADTTKAWTEESRRVYCVKETCMKPMQLRGWLYNGARIWRCRNCGNQVECQCEEHRRPTKHHRHPKRKPERLDVYHLVFDDQGESTCRRRMRHVSKGYRCDHCHVYVHKQREAHPARGRYSKKDHGEVFKATCVVTDLLRSKKCMTPMSQQTDNGVPVLCCQACGYKTRCRPLKPYNPNARTRRATIKAAPEDVSTIVMRAVDAMRRSSYLHDGEREEIIGNMLLDIYAGGLKIEDVDKAKANQYRLRLRREYDPRSFTSFDAPIGKDGWTLLDVLDDAGNIRRPATTMKAKAA